MVIGHFRRAAAGMLLRNYLEASDAAAAAEVLPPPLLKVRDSHIGSGVPHLLEAIFLSSELEPFPARTALLTQLQPSSMRICRRSWYAPLRVTVKPSVPTGAHSRLACAQGNEVMKAEHCIFHDEFRAIVKQADGFQWTNEAAEGEPPKVGSGFRMSRHERNFRRIHPHFVS